MSREIDPALFRETLGHYPTGVAVVTAVTEDGTPAGMVVGTFSSVSMNPPLIAFYPMSNSRSFATLRTAATFCINVLASDQEALCRQMATGGEHKFDGVGWKPGSARLPDPRRGRVLGRVHVRRHPRGRRPLHRARPRAGARRRTVDAAPPLLPGRVRALLSRIVRRRPRPRTDPGSAVGRDDPLAGRAAQRRVRRQLQRRRQGPLGRRAGACRRTSRPRPSPSRSVIGSRSSRPFGAVFMANAPEADVDEWLQRAPDHSEERRELNRSQLEKVREHGYSLLAAGTEVLQRHQAVLSAFEQSDRLPRHERAVQQATSPSWPTSSSPTSCRANATTSRTSWCPSRREKECPRWPCVSPGFPPPCPRSRSSRGSTP